MNTYELSRSIFDYSYVHPDKIKPGHIAVYFFIIDHCNRLGDKEKFGLPTMMTCEAIGIAKPSTMITYLLDLAAWDFITIHARSSNQYSTNIISINKPATPKKGGAIGRAIGKRKASNVISTNISIDPIDKQETLETKELKDTTSLSNFKNFIKPTLDELINYFEQKGLNGQSTIEAHKFLNHYESIGWKVGKTKMVSWTSAVAGWISRMDNFNTSKNKTTHTHVEYEGK